MDLVRAVSSLSTLSIGRNAQYLGLRSCAGSCLYAPFGFSDLVSYIGCQYPFYNTCYCNSVIVPQASSFVSSCVSVACNEVADVPDAFSAWEGYCSTAGYPVNNIAQTTVDTITSGTVTAPTTIQVTVPTTTAPTVTATTPAGSRPSSGSTAAAASTFSADSNSQSASSPTSSATTTTQMNVGIIAGGVVGGVVAIGVVAIIITMLILRDRRSRREQQLAQPPAWQPPPAPFTPPVMTESIFKTPAMTNTAPVYRTEESAQHEPELDGRARMGPELDGLGSYRPRTNVPEMQG